MILTPTRELCDQIFTLSVQLNSCLPPEKRLKIRLLIGGLPFNDDYVKFKRGADLIVGTTGRIFMHLTKKSFSLEKMRLAIFDEADVLIKGKEFRKIFGLLRAERSIRPLQICCYSATFSQKNLFKFCRFLYPSEKIQNNCYIRPKNASKTEDVNGDDIQSLNLENLRQFTMEVEKSDIKSIPLVKMDKVIHLLQNLEFSQAIIFYNDKGRGDQLVEELK